MSLSGDPAVDKLVVAFCKVESKLREALKTIKHTSSQLRGGKLNKHHHNFQDVYEAEYVRVLNVTRDRISKVKAIVDNPLLSPASKLLYCQLIEPFVRFVAKEYAKGWIELANCHLERGVSVGFATRIRQQIVEVGDLANLLQKSHQETMAALGQGSTETKVTSPKKPPPTPSPEKPCPEVDNEVRAFLKLKVSLDDVHRQAEDLLTLHLGAKCPSDQNFEEFFIKECIRFSCVIIHRSNNFKTFLKPLKKVEHKYLFCKKVEPFVGRLTGDFVDILNKLGVCFVQRNFAYNKKVEENLTRLNDSAAKLQKVHREQMNNLAAQSLVSPMTKLTLSSSSPTTTPSPTPLKTEDTIQLKKETAKIDDEVKSFTKLKVPMEEIISKAHDLNQEQNDNHIDDFFFCETERYRKVCHDRCTKLPAIVARFTDYDHKYQFLKKIELFMSRLTGDLLLSLTSTGKLYLKRGVASSQKIQKELSMIGEWANKVKNCYREQMDLLDQGTSLLVPETSSLVPETSTQIDSYEDNSAIEILGKTITAQNDVIEKMSTTLDEVLGTVKLLQERLLLLENRVAQLELNKPLPTISPSKPK